MPFDVLCVRKSIASPMRGGGPKGRKGGGMSLSVSAPSTPPGSLRSPTSPERGGEMPFDVLCVRKSIASPMRAAPAGASR